MIFFAGKFGLPMGPNFAVYFGEKKHWLLVTALR
jgi:hypothetical protein